MRRFVVLAGLLFSAFSGGAVGNTASETLETSRLNVVLIYADDLGFMDLGCYGSSFYETPQIDNLASRGARFTRAYAAAPICSPSRAALLTGKFPMRLATTDWFGAQQPHEPVNPKKPVYPLLPAAYRDYLPQEEITLAEALKERGYNTFMAGKWHLGNGKLNAPDKHGFDESFTTKDLAEVPREHLAGALADRTIQFMESHRDQPFFVYLPLVSVHLPLSPRAELLAKYEKKRQEMGLKDEVTTDGLHTTRRNQSLAAYGAVVEDMDQAVGKVLQGIEENGLTDRTVVIFTSDNGGLSTGFSGRSWPTSNEPLRAGKGWLYEGGIRVPLIVYWPGLTRTGTTVETLTVGTDLYPTLLAGLGHAMLEQQHVDGVSLLPALEGKSAATSATRMLVWHYPHYANQGALPGSVLMEDPWKLIKWYDGNRYELFNLADDPNETKELSVKYPERVKDMAARLQEYLPAAGARFPVPNPAFTGIVNPGTPTVEDGE